MPRIARYLYYLVDEHEITPYWGSAGCCYTLAGSSRTWGPGSSASKVANSDRRGIAGSTHTQDSPEGRSHSPDSRGYRDSLEEEGSRVADSPRGRTGGRWAAGGSWERIASAT